MLDRSAKSLPRSLRPTHKLQLAFILALRNTPAVLSVPSMIVAPRARISYTAVPTETGGDHSNPPDTFHEFKNEEMSK
jgi:hypothetical protein